MAKNKAVGKNLKAAVKVAFGVYAGSAAVAAGASESRTNVPSQVLVEIAEHLRERMPADSSSRMLPEKGVFDNLRFGARPDVAVDTTASRIFIRALPYQGERPISWHSRALAAGEYLPSYLQELLNERRHDIDVTDVRIEPALADSARGAKKDSLNAFHIPLDVSFRLAMEKPREESNRKNAVPLDQLKKGKPRMEPYMMREKLRGR